MGSMKRIISFFLLLTLTAAAYAGTVAEGGSCSSTNDCGPNLACFYRQLTDQEQNSNPTLQPGGMSCDSNSQCFSGSCSGGICGGDKVCTTATADQISASLNAANPTCFGLGLTPVLGLKCCQGLQVNAAGKCDEVPYNDPALVSCTSDAQCTGGTSCLPQSYKDLFSATSPNTGSQESLSSMQTLIQGSMEENPKPNGAVCSLSSDCQSYNCVKTALGGTCQEKLVCRFAAEGESSSAQCASGLVKSPNGSCIKDPNAAHVTYPGLPSGDASVGEKCKLNLPEDYRNAALAGMRTLRAMEFLFSNISLKVEGSGQQQCFDDIPTVRDQFGKPLLKTRREVLKPFSDFLHQIEVDQKLVMESEKMGDQTVTIHEGETMKASDLSSRMTSGFDAAVLMYRRAKLMKEYETRMLETVNTAAPTALKFSQNLLWGDNDNSWKVADQQKQAWNCDGSWYKKCNFWGLFCKTRYWNEVKDRWANYLKVNATAETNKVVFSREELKTALKYISGAKSDSEAIAPFLQNHYLMDPLMTNGLDISTLGPGISTNTSSGFLGFNKIKDRRHAYAFTGSGAGSYAKMREFFKAKIIEHYKSLKEDPNQTDFVYEAELNPVEEKDCLNGKDCPKFTKYIEDTTDDVLAFWLAWSYYKNSTMSGFYTANNFRVQLAARISADMTVLTDYYTKVIKARENQMQCLSTLMGGLEEQGILASGGGVSEGGVYYNGTRPTGADGNPSTKRKSTGSVASLIRSKFNYNLSGGSLKSLGAGSKMDYVGKDALGNGGAADFLGQAAALNAARIQAMKDANDKASLAGVDVAGKAQVYKDTIASMAKSSGAGGSSALGSSGSGGSARSGFGFGSAGAASLGKDTTKSGDKSDSSSSAHKDGTNPGAAAVSGSSAPNLSSIGGVDANTEDYMIGGKVKGGANTTGLSDNDKNRIMSEYEKNRKDYEGSDGDGLFRKVSKAYVRNLGKFLKKKEAEPEEPVKAKNDQ